MSDEDSRYLGSGLESVAHASDHGMTESAVAWASAIIADVDSIFVSILLSDTKELQLKIL